MRLLPGARQRVLHDVVAIGLARQAARETGHRHQMRRHPRLELRRRLVHTLFYAPGARKGWVGGSFHDPQYFICPRNFMEVWMSGRARGIGSVLLVGALAACSSSTKSGAPAASSTTKPATDDPRRSAPAGGPRSPS